MDDGHRLTALAAQLAARLRPAHAWLLDAVPATAPDGRTWLFMGSAWPADLPLWVAVDSARRSHWRVGRHGQTDGLYLLETDPGPGLTDAAAVARVEAFLDAAEAVCVPPRVAALFRDLALEHAWLDPRIRLRTDGRGGTRTYEVAGTWCDLPLVVGADCPCWAPADEGSAADATEAACRARALRDTAPWAWSVRSAILQTPLWHTSTVAPAALAPEEGALAVRAYLRRHTAAFVPDAYVEAEAEAETDDASPGMDTVALYSDIAQDDVGA